MKIITISREFGSGGRELGKRLAEELGFDYYDREIITTIANRCHVNENYAEYMLSHSFPPTITVSMRQSFHTPAILQATQISLMQEQTKVIHEIAHLGRDCVIVGRNADLLLADHTTLNIFVCSDMESKLKRCIERAQPGEDISEKGMIRKIKQIDGNRKKNREMISNSKWGSRETYHLIINTSGWDMHDLTPHIASFAKGWFESREKNEKTTEK